MIEDREAQEGEPEEELASRETINTPIVTTTHTGKEKYCHFNKNDELLISIIFQHIDMPIFIVAIHAPSELPPCPSQRRTKSMIHEGMETQTLAVHGFVYSPPNDDDNIPIIASYYNAKKIEIKEKVDVQTYDLYLDVYRCC